MYRYKIHGIVAKGFQSVKEEFERNFINGIESNSQLCVYFNGTKVVDLWGTLDDSNNTVGEDGNAFDGDSIATVFSSTKVLSAICMATLVEKQLLNYSDKVIKHWPEYGNGDKDKESMTVSQILRHEGGMAKFSKTVTLADIQAENIKKNSIGKIIEKETLCFPSPKTGTTREYHAVTRGWILNEIFRRVDPEHRTIGECLRQDISTPLDVDAYIGLQYEELPKSYNMSMLSLPQVTVQSLLPDRFRKIEPTTFNLAKLAALVLPHIKSVPILEHLTASVDITESLKKFTYTVVKTGELPSANGQCSARALAKLSAMMANKGEIDGIRIFSEETWDAIHHDFDDKDMHPTGETTSFSQGGMHLFKPVENGMFLTKYNECRQGFVGWMGLGGSVMQWHTEHNIGFGYVPTFLAWEDTSNMRGAFLQKKVVECVKELTKENWVFLQ